MTKDESLIEVCKTLLQDPRVTEQEGWQKLVLVGEVNDTDVGMRGYSFDIQGNCKLVAPKASNLDKLKQFHDVMKAESPTGRGWLKCMLRISRNGEVGADFEYNDSNRWSHTPENYKARIAEYAAMPV